MIGPAVFKNREARIRFVKSENNGNSSHGKDKVLHPETVKLITERSKEVVKYVALSAVGVYAAFKTIDTLSQIAVKKTKSADHE